MQRGNVQITGSGVKRGTGVPSNGTSTSRGPETPDAGAMPRAQGMGAYGCNSYACSKAPDRALAEGQGHELTEASRCNAGMTASCTRRTRRQTVNFELSYWFNQCATGPSVARFFARLSFRPGLASRWSWLGLLALPFAGVLQGKDFGHFDLSGGFGQNLFLAFPCSLGACSLALAASLAALESSSVVACRSFRGSAGVPRWFLSVLPAFRATRGSVAHSVCHLLTSLPEQFCTTQSRFGRQAFSGDSLEVD